MHIGLMILIGALVFTAIAELLYILSLRKNIEEIANSFEEKLSMDTNTGISVTTRDVYIRRLASRINKELMELRKERLRLQQGDQELKNAVSNIAHDLRTPLTAISGYLELMEEIPKDEKINDYLDIVSERTEALKKLTDEIFRYSVITSTSDDLSPVSLSLKSELEVAIAGAYSMLVEYDISPEINLPEEPVMRMLDQNALRRIFTNLLSNAAKYSEGDLTITLDTNGCITFKNKAPNLSEVEAGKMFDRFYTVENAKGSTGLGLSIAKLLTGKMGGTIEAELVDNCLTITLCFQE